MFIRTQFCFRRVGVKLVAAYGSRVQLWRLKETPEEELSGLQQRDSAEYGLLWLNDTIVTVEAFTVVVSKQGKPQVTAYMHCEKMFYETINVPTVVCSLQTITLVSSSKQYQTYIPTKPWVSMVSKGSGRDAAFLSKRSSNSNCANYGRDNHKSSVISCWLSKPIQSKWPFKASL